MTKNELHVWKLAAVIQDGICDAYERDGGEDLNDSLLAQIQGMDETIYELREDIDAGLDEKHYKSWLKALNHDYDMLKQIRAHQDWKDAEPEIEWIYA